MKSEAVPRIFGHAIRLVTIWVWDMRISDLENAFEVAELNIYISLFSPTAVFLPLKCKIFCLN